MDRKEAADLLDNLIGMVEDSGGRDYDTALMMGIEALKEAQPERDGFTTWALSVADSYRVKAIIEKFRDYQVEWLTAHCDLEFCKEEEDAIVRFLHDTANCFEMEVENETD